MSVVVCIDLSGKELHSQVDIDTVVTSRSLGGVAVSTLTQNAKDVGSNPAVGTVFTIFITLIYMMLFICLWWYIYIYVYIERDM